MDRWTLIVACVLACVGIVYVRTVPRWLAYGFVLCVGVPFILVVWLHGLGGM
jgi:hypothetical protein